MFPYHLRSCETKLFDKDQADYINLNLYGILRGNSVSHKSGYIKSIRKAFDFVEQYFRSQLTDSNDKFITTCIESLTPAKLLVELEQSSKFISSDEDRPLTDFSFFEPNLPKAKEAQTCLISAFNGAYKVQRSTMTYSKDIRDKSLTMLVPTTGDRWPLLLEYFSESYQTNGLYERILYWVISKKNFVHEDSSLNESLPCLEYLYVTRMLIANRVYEYEDDAINYLRPILYKMRHNGPSCEGLFSIPKNKRAEACERRGADLVERIAVIVQNIFDTLKVLEPVKSVNFSSIKKDTLNEIKVNTGNYFYSNEMLSQVNNNSLYSDNVDLKDLNEVQITTVNKAPSQSMKVRLSAVKIAVNLFHKLLLPQSIQLFCADTINNKKPMLNELKIIQYPLNCFSISDLTYGSIFHNHKRDNIDVKQLLSNLEKNRLVRCGKFIRSTFRLVESWIKMLPDPTNDEEVQRFKDELNNTYQLDFEKYVHLYQQGVDDKSPVTETAHNTLSTQRSWIEELQQKNHNSSVQTKSSESTTDLFPSSPSIQQTTLCTNVVQDIIHLIADRTIEPIDIIQDINVPSVIEDSVESTIESNPTTVTDNSIFTISIPNRIFDTIGQAIANSDGTNGQAIVDPTTSNVQSIVDPTSSNGQETADRANSNVQSMVDRTTSNAQETVDRANAGIQSMVDPTTPNGQAIVDRANTAVQGIAASIQGQNDTVSPSVFLTACTSMSDHLITENMKSLCKKILLTDSIILSSTKLNKVCKMNMVDVHKACHLLIENGLLTKEKKMLANKSSYHECYFKKVASDKSKLVDFSFKLAKFGIPDVDAYHNTLKTIDTKNTTYLSPYGMSILEEKPYSELEITVDKNAIIQPLKERCHELSDASDITHREKENSTSEKAGGSTNIEQNLEPSVSNSKRRRELTSKAKEYKDDQFRSKKKKN